MVQHEDVGCACVLGIYILSVYVILLLIPFLCRVLKKDPYHTGCLPIHVSCLVELKQPNSK